MEPFGLLMVVCAGNAGYKVLRHCWIQAYGTRIVGRIERHEKSSDEYGTGYLSIAVFTVHGQNYEAKGLGWARSKSPDNLGGEVEICYLPDDPAAARIYYPAWKLVLATGFMAMLMAFGLSRLWG